MKEQLDQQLADKFSFMEACDAWTGEKLGHSVYCSCGDGWYQLIHELCQEISDLYNEKGKDPSTLRVDQVKEKYGGLRFYVGSYIEGVQQIISKYEDKSYEICEICGKPGETRGIHWVQTLCDEHNKL